MLLYEALDAVAFINIFIFVGIFLIHFTGTRSTGVTFAAEKGSSYEEQR